MTATTELGPIEIIPCQGGGVLARRLVNGFMCHGNSYNSEKRARQSLAKVVRAVRNA